MTYYILQGVDPNDRKNWNPTVWDAEPVDYEWLTIEQYQERFPPLEPEPVEPTDTEKATAFYLGIMESYNEQ